MKAGRISAAGIREFHGDESGAVTFFFVFGLIALVFLLALIFNTSKQTIRKMEMQGAADSAARAGGVTAGRAMNLMTFNNRGMAQTIAVMMSVRALLQTSEVMVVVLPQLAARVGLLNPALAAQLLREAAAYGRLIVILTPINRNVTQLGWRVMNALDAMNRGVKQTFPILAQQKAIEFARLNGADEAPYSVLLAGLPAAPPLLFPVARGPQKLLIVNRDKCLKDSLDIAAFAVLVKTGPLSSLLALYVYKGLFECNAATLNGGGGLCGIFGFRTPMLSWPANPPRPMILTDRPSRSASATVEVDEAKADLLKVRQYLQFLSLTFGRLPAESSIGNRYFENPARRWFTYAEADVYNPTRWSMFTQDWRAKIARSNVFNQKIAEIGNYAGAQGIAGSASDWSFVNVH
jgi:hypothetical protein